MTTAQALLDFRKKRSLSQEELAEKLLLTRQAVSRWETGETVPNTDTLKLISKTFGVSINALLGQPQNTMCQVCGAPLEEGVLSREADGTVNDAFCKWCYVDGAHQYETMEEVIAAVIPHLNWGTPEQMKAWLRQQLLTLPHWKSSAS